ncbi:uncharacterized protein LOC119084454 [Bradysia coprophila]|uniref:uncharacterized protein LOC119084454 n=1 Tax=Bradysia coprophila TaxID=38358 RepID=UPI00187DA5AF|nr:uncharacterized protein LOC119084454 [Bradysia coprophila]
MLILKLITLYIYLYHAETFQLSTIHQSNYKLSARLMNVICSTDSNTVRFLVIDDDKPVEVDEYVARLNEECPFKTIQLFGINTILSESIQHHSELIVYLVYSNDSIQNFRWAVTKSNRSNSHNRFVVVFRFQYKWRILVNIFKDLARQTISNIVVIVHADDSEEIVLLYNPFDEVAGIVEDVSILERTDLFTHSRGDLHGRKLVISMHEQCDRAVLKKNGMPGYTGVDGLIADLLEERMNLTFQYITPHEMYNGYRNSGVIGDLTVGHAEMSFNADSLALLLVNDASVAATDPFERNDMCVLVPKAGNEPIIWNLLRTMSKMTWVITLLSIVVMMLIYRWTQSVQKLIHSRKYPFYEYSWKDISTIIFQSFFGDAIRRIPQSMPLRILIIGWCIYSFLITNAFQAKLISSLVLPKGLEDIHTVEELGHSNLEIMYPRALGQLIQEYTDNGTMNILRDQLVEVASWSEFDAFINNKSSTTAYIMMRFHADLMEKRNFDKITGRPFYKTMDQCFLTFPRVYFLKLGSMYVDHVSEMLRRFHETGFIVKWTKHSEFISALHGNIPVDDIEEEDVDEADIKVVITPEHLQTSFILLVFGLIAASLVFVGEKVYFNWNRNE